MPTLHFLVGVTGFEPATSWSRTKRTTKLCHTPKDYFIPKQYITEAHFCQHLFANLTKKILPKIRQDFCILRLLFYSFSSIKFDKLSIFSSSSSIRESKSSISSTLISLMASSRCSIRSISSS